MTAIVKYKDRDEEVLQGVTAIENGNGEVLIDGERYLKKDIARIEVVWR
jgi:hypothetical protein